MLPLRKIQEVLAALKIKEKINDTVYAIPFRIIDQDLLDLRLEHTRPNCMFTCGIL